MFEIKKSKLREKLFAYFFDNIEKELYLREIAREIDVDPTNLSRELERLEKDGVFLSTKRGGQKYFRLNKDYIFFHELKKIIRKTIGAEQEIGDLVRGEKGIKYSFIYGSFAKGKERSDSDIDLFIIGKINVDKFLEKISRLEKRIGREINYRVYEAGEILKKMARGDSFIRNVVNGQVIFLTNNESEFRKIIKGRQA